MKLRDMKGLGPKTEQQLMTIGIQSPEDLKRIGAVPAFLQLQRSSLSAVSLNFLYALVGAIEDKSWQHIAKTEKSRLIQELEGYKEFTNYNHDDDSHFTW